MGLWIIVTIKKKYLIIAQMVLIFVTKICKKWLVWYLKDFWNVTDCSDAPLEALYTECEQT